jgi:hypothetical protein
VLIFQFLAVLSHNRLVAIKLIKLLIYKLFIVFTFVKPAFQELFSHLLVKSRVASLLTCIDVLLVPLLLLLDNLLSLDLLMAKVAVELLNFRLEIPQGLRLELSSMNERHHVSVPKLLILVLGLAVVVKVLLDNGVKGILLVDVLANGIFVHEGPLLLDNVAFVLWKDTH